MDRVTKQVRSKIMASVHTRDTGAEMIVRSLVHKSGYRYALHRKDLPGKPDLTFVSRRKIIFVHGCFWHGHHCRYGKLPQSRIDYWSPKIATNKQRDRYQICQLRKMGWSVIIVWQCQLKRLDLIESKIVKFLEHE